MPSSELVKGARVTFKDCTGTEKDRVMSFRQEESGAADGLSKNVSAMRRGQAWSTLGPCPASGTSKKWPLLSVLAACLPQAGGVTGSNWPESTRVGTLLVTGA